jgi:hypothetical protein
LEHELEGFAVNRRAVRAKLLDHEASAHHRGQHACAVGG